MLLPLVFLREVLSTLSYLDEDHTAKDMALSPTSGIVFWFVAMFVWFLFICLAKAALSFQRPLDDMGVKGA